MSAMGSLDHYVAGTPFTNYFERLESLAKFNNWNEENKKCVLISLSGSVVYDELKLMFPGKELLSLKYDDMIKKLKERFDKVEPDMMQRYRFYNRYQRPEESAESFILAVKLQAENCDFKQFKETAIRDRLIMGLHDKELQKKLLMDEDLSLPAVERKIISSEIAGNTAKSIYGPESRDSSDVNSIKNRLGKRVYDRQPREYDRHPREYDRYPREYDRQPREYDRQHREYEREPRESRDRSRNRNERKHVSFRERSPSNNKDINPYANAICNYCKKKGHLRRQCPNYRNRNTVRFVEESNTKTNKSYNFKREDDHNSSDADTDGMECMLITAVNRINEPCMVEVVVEDQKLHMEIDSGSAVSVISDIDYLEYFGTVPISTCDRQLVVVNGDRLQIVGEIKVRVELKGQASYQKLIILECDKNFVPLVGRTWLDVYYPDWRAGFVPETSVNNLNVREGTDQIVQHLKLKYSKLFNKDFSEPIEGYEGELLLKHDQPIFRKAYTVPYKLKDKLVQHLEMLEQQNVISPLKASEWASPVIVVIKKDQDIRMVIDCKVSINQVIVPNSYPLPLAQDIFASLAGCTVFCCLDLAGAYTQVQLSERSKRFMVINTLKGLFTYNRLPQGASSSAAIFQQIMDQVLQGLKHVCCYLDDVLIAGKNLAECIKNLELVLERLSKANVKVNFSKCKFFVNKLQYLGHLITDEGLLPSPEKLSTIEQAKTPENISELRAYLGLINYYHKFVPHLSTKLSSLHALLLKGSQFEWTKESDEAFLNSKKSLLEANILEFYDPNKPLIVVSDACLYGLGGVLAHEINGQEKPICFTSFSLNPAQKKYPILHLEALALVCTIKKFHKFLFGQKFRVFTDHKPLLGIFGKSGSNSVFVTRLQRYVMELSIYDFEIAYRPSALMGNADFCSRFPLKQNVPRSLDVECINSLNFTNNLPLDNAQIAEETKSDPYLAEILTFVENGWPKSVKERYKDMFSLRADLEVIENCILYQGRVVIPVNMRLKILRLLHANHIGIVKMKELARQTVFWPRMNFEIENYIKQCEVCIKTSPAPSKPPHNNWIPTTRPFSRLHADFFYFDRKMFLLMVDSHSKWVEVEIMPNGTDAKRVIEKFMAVFARFGLPDVVVTDGGPPFNSKEFVGFLVNHGIKAMKSPPYNPSSNGQAERLVRVVKDALKKHLLDPNLRHLDLASQLHYFLFNYRNQVATTDGFVPSSKMFTYKPKVLLDLIHPEKQYKKFLEKPKQSKNIDIPIEQAPDPFEKLVVGDKIFYKNFRKTDPQRWIEARFIKRLSKNVFQISLHRNVLSAHRNQLKLLTTTKNSKLLVPPRASRKRSWRDSEDEDFRGFENETDERPFSRFLDNLDKNLDGPTRPKMMKRNIIMTRSRTREACNVQSELEVAESNNNNN